MAFSLFGKKPPSQPAGKAPARKAVRPAPLAAKPRPAAPEPAPAAASQALDFTVPDALRAEEPASIEIRESAVSHPVIEEAAILYANCQDEVALTSLEAAVAGNTLGPAADQAWGMLFDLYQLMDKGEAFESRALEYSLRFEKSPPTWVEPEREPVNPALATGGHAYIAFTGTLGEAADRQIKQLERIVARSPMARVELGRLQHADVLGAAPLRKVMQAARRTGCELVLGGAEKFAQLLAGKLETGRREDGELWLLLLELYQHLRRQEPYEEWALNYAITFEVSPPAWEAERPKKKPAPPPAEVATDTFCLRGEMYGAGSDAFQRLLEYAANRPEVLIDCAGLKRMDFVAAGMFLNTLTSLQRAGKTVLVRGANQLLCALFGVLGINQVAQIERRKI